MFRKEEKSIYDALLYSNSDIKWDYKDNSNVVMCDIDSWDDSSSKDYKRMKETFEKTSCKVRNPHIYISKVRNEIGEYEDAFYPHYDFQKLNQNIKCICPTTGKLVKKQPNFSLPTYSSMKMFPPNSMTSPNSTASGKNRSRREYNDYLRKKVEQSRSQSASPDARARSASRCPS